MRQSLREFEAEWKAKKEARALFEEENKEALSKCKPFSWVEFYKAQPAPQGGELPDIESDATDATDEYDTSNMMEYLGLSESDFFYG